MSALLAAQLRSLVAALRDDLKPELSSAQARLRAELIDMLLTRLAVEAEEGREPDPLAPGLMDRLAEADLANPQQRAEVNDLVAALAAREHARRGTLEQKIAASAAAPAAGKRSAAELSIEPARFTAYLRRRFPDDPAIAATRLTTVPGGRSKGTILVDLEGASLPREIVIRRDFDASVTGTSVSYEYPILRAAFAAGLPVPEPLWLEDDPAALGGRFIAFARVPGRALGTLFSSDAPAAVVREFAAALARLHALDVDGADLAHRLEGGADPHPVRAMVERAQRRYRSQVPPTPLMDAAFAWLAGQLDAIGNTRALVHGDAGLHNCMGDEQHLTALLDWEFAHLGDPAEDLTYCKYLVERILPWDEFMAIYHAHGGQPVSQQRMRFFTIWRTLHLAILTGAAQTMFESGRDQDLRIAGIGYNTFPRQLRDLAADLAAFTARG